MPETSDTLIVQHLDAAGRLRDQFAGIVGVRLSGDPVKDETASWRLPLGVKAPVAERCVVILLDHPKKKWAVTAVESSDDGHVLTCEVKT